MRKQIRADAILTFKGLISPSIDWLHFKSNNHSPDTDLGCDFSLSVIHVLSDEGSTVFVYISESWTQFAGDGRDTYPIFQYCL